MVENIVAPPSVQKSIQDIETFFEPALRDRSNNGYIADRLLVAKPDAPSIRRADLLKRAGGLLASLHSALRYDQSVEKSVYDSSLLLAAYKLLDFLSLEGVYPSLPAGVGLLHERRSKALFYKNLDPSYVSPASEGTLGLVMEALDFVLEQLDLGIEPLVRQRILADIIVVKAWLAYQHGTPQFAPSFLAYLRKLPLFTLFQTYTALLKSNQPDWLRSTISGQLSGLSLRPNGVRGTIEFIAASYQGGQSQNSGDEAQASGGPSIPLDTMQQASRLLSSVPSSMTADQYFTKIAPQLLELLDNSKEYALQTAAAHVIGSGILGKRSTGAPGAIGWKLFVEPLLLSIRPTGSSSDTGDADAKRALVPEQDLRLALQRLSTLLLSQPNPGLTGRLLKSLLLPLWAISNVKASSFAATETAKAADALLRRFFELVGNVQDLYTLVDEILWDGQRTWTYGLGKAGGIAIVERLTAEPGISESALEAQMSLSTRRAKGFCQFLQAARVGNKDIAAVLSRLCREQFGRVAPDERMLHVDENPFLKLAKVQLLQEMMEAFSDEVSKIAVEMLEVVDTVLQSYLDYQAAAASLSQGTAKPTLAGILRIAKPAEGPTDENFGADEVPLTIALSLLTTILTSASDLHSAEATAKLNALPTQLQAISIAIGANNPLKSQIQTALARLATLRAARVTAQQSAAQPESDHDSQALQMILTDLSAPLPPLRRSALHALNALITSPLTTLEVPPLTLRLLELIRTDSEEFVYLAAIQTSVSLALHRNLSFVCGVFAEAFQDLAERTGVDGRLRVGEALFSLAGEMDVQYAGVFKRGETVRGMARTLLEVAGRRGRRTREAGERELEERMRVRRRKDAERAWGGELPDLELPGLEGGTAERGELTGEEGEARRNQLDEMEKLVAGWEDTGFAEDVRIRASALSILGRLLETRGPDFTPELLDGVTELALSVLTMELSASAAILRRASALAVYGSLKSVDAALEAESGVPTAEMVGGARWTKIERVMRWVWETEDDALTSGHAETVLEGLEAVRMKILQRAGREEERGLDGRLRGLHVEPGEHDGRRGRGGSTEKKAVIEELE